VAAARSIAVAFAVTLAGCDAPLPDPGELVARDGPMCGDGIVDEGEACDLGFANRPDGPCRDCRLPTCGDGVRDEGEDCDDADDDDTDACRADCRATLGEAWARRSGSGAAAERVSDLAIDGSGDVIVAGFRDAAHTGVVHPFVARYDPGGDVRWSVVLEDPGVAHAIAQREDGDLVVAVTRAPQPEMPGDVRVVKLDLGDGSVRLDLAPTTEIGRAVAIATAGDEVFVAYNAETGPGRVVALDAAGAVASTDAIAQVPLLDLRALATVPGGDLLVAGGNAEASTGFVARVSASGERRHAVDDLDGPVVDVIAAGDGALAAITARIESPDPQAPWTWTTGVRILALDGDGEARWSTRLEPDRGRREAGALAASEGRIVVVGTDPVPAATCSATHCERRPWAAALDAESGSVRWAFALQTDVQGRAYAVGLHEGRVVVGGDVRPLFSPDEAWISSRVEVEP
jgi:outer membrane protein assembly factor BamB